VIDTIVSTARRRLAMPPARDRDDVAGPHGREVGRDGAVDLVPEPDHDPGRETRRRLGDRCGERVTGAASESLEGDQRMVWRVLHLERSRPQRAHDASPPQVLSVRTLRRRAHRTRDGHAHPRLDLRIPRQRRGNTAGRRRQEREVGDL
jgi:hypothetical protein